LAGDLQKCVFPLDSYEEANYYYHDPKALDSYVNTVAGYIEETETVKGCTLLSVTAWGYADSQRLIKILPWPNVPEYCRSQAACRKDESSSENLTNDDLACVRQCLVTNRIYSLLEHDTEIFPNTLEKWKSEHHSFTRPSEVGEAYRKVEVILERGGQCPDD
jgi:hypothetical protein